MKSKYDFVKIDWKDWSKYFNYTRDLTKEQQLYDLLGLQPLQRYNFVNANFASPPLSQKTSKINLNTDLKTVTMDYIKGYSVFDWSLVIENAENIVTVETCLNFLIEKLPVKAKRLIMVSKWEPPDFHHIEGLFSKPWEYLTV